MTPNIHVENHQPVPLVPFKDFDVWDGRVAYVHDVYWRKWPEEKDPAPWSFRGWVVFGENYQLFHADGGDGSWEMWDEGRTMVRPLQPGERLVVTYEGGG